MKKYFINLCIILFIFFSSNTIVKASETDLQIYSKYAILYNMNDDNIIYEKNANDRTSIASLTKIMTSIVALENINSLDDTVVLTNDVFKGLVEANASVAGFRLGEKVTYRDLVMGALLPSGADATRALSINICGSEDKFVELMNKKVQELNLTNTHFDNTTGLENPTHYSSVYDISVILKYALQNAEFKKMYTTREYTTTNGLKFYSTLKKISNNYTIDVGNILGSKTGYTDEAGLCMSSIANYNDVDYLLVTAGADYRGNTPRQLMDAVTIYNYFSNNYGYKNIITKNKQIKTIKVKYSKEKEYAIISPIDISKYLENSINVNDFTYEYEGIEEISYKNLKDEKLGTVKILYNGEVLDTVDIFLTEAIKFNMLAFLIQTNLIYLIGGILFIIILFIIIHSKKARI